MSAQNIIDSGEINELYFKISPETKWQNLSNIAPYVIDWPDGPDKSQIGLKIKWDAYAYSNDFEDVEVVYKPDPQELSYVGINLNSSEDWDKIENNILQKVLDVFHG